MASFDPPLVLAVHGTRSALGTRTSLELAEAVADASGADVRLGWVDIHTPTLTDTLRELGEAIVVPAFLTSGYHVTSDIPAAITAAGGLATATPLIGADVLPAVLDRLEPVGEFDAVVLAGAGSLRQRAVAEVRAVTRTLARAVDRPALAGFVTASSPTVPEAVATLRAAGHRRVAIASYLLAPGRFSEQLEDAGADAVSEPIGVHPLLVDAIVRRWRAAVAEPLTDSRPKAVND
ncbi:MAG: CbiX/SirB N-terminal domain-containing protein [Micropruina sp.]|uniref:sirohydrochlorin chelatase n=1 Tax=Micropruina sp. TaxID=2737536 RepID=UPI0039E4EE5E